MNNEEKILSLLEQMLSEQKSMKEDIQRIDQTVTRIENVHGQKLIALFDGNEQHTQQLSRIEKEVSRQQEVVFRRLP